MQSVRALHLKTLYLSNSKSYQSSLKTTACHTLDRDTLFDFITSKDFLTHKGMLEREDIQRTTESLKVLQHKPTSTIDDLIQSFDRLSVNQKNAKQNDQAFHLNKNTNDNLNIHQNTPQSDEISLLSKQNEKNNREELQKKQGLIDKFIELNPKIVPTKKTTLSSVNIEDSLADNNSIMTETLAKIYLEQKKYLKAIQAYEILILKYPEKSSFFADQISDIKALQQHNS